MKQIPAWKYILLGVAAFFVVVVLVYLRVASDFHVPVTSLLPSNPLIKKLLPLPTVLPVVPAPIVSVKHLTMTSGAPLYIITGKFVTAPVYNAQQLLQGDFVINGDPGNNRIPVIMTKKSEKITVEKSQGSFDGGKNTVASEDTETFRQSITVNAPVQLRLYSGTSTRFVNDIPGHDVLDRIINGNWSIPSDFILHPPMIGLIE